MTVPPAALPGHNLPGAPVEFVDAPGRHELLVCPNCRSGEALQVTYPATIAVPAEVVNIDSVTVPEVRHTGDGTAALVPGGRVAKVACTNCRWSYEGPDPIGRLQPAEK